MRNLIPSTAKTQETQNFDLGNVWAVVNNK